MTGGLLGRWGRQKDFIQDALRTIVGDTLFQSEQIWENNLDLFK